MASDNENQAVIDFARENLPLEIVDLGDGHNAIVLPKGRELHSIKHLSDKYLQKPERQTGVSIHGTPQSLIDHIKRFAIEDQSVIFANLNRENPEICAVYNYRKPNETSFGDWKAKLSLTLSDAWKAWNENNGELLSQEEFAEFIEANSDNIVSPPDDLNDPSYAGVKALAMSLGFSVAGAQAIIGLSRGIEVNSEYKAKNIVNTTSGERNIQYFSQNNGVDGQKLKVPDMFLISIPVFQNGLLFRMPVRLRYRISNDVIKWGFQIYQPEKNFDAAYENECNAVVKATDLPIFYGQPE